MMDRSDEDELTWKVESLWGKIDPKSFGDRVNRGKPERKRPLFPFDPMSGDELIGLFQEECDEFEKCKASEDYVRFLELEDEEDEESGQEQSVAWIDNQQHMMNEREEKLIASIKEEAQRLKEKTGGDIKDSTVGWCKNPQMIDLDKAFDVKESDEACDPEPPLASLLNNVLIKIIDTALFEPNNLLVCAPPRTGKRVPVLTILRQLDLDRRDRQISLSVYVAPMSGRVDELVNYLSHCLRDLPVTVSKQLLSVHRSQIIVTTPENWDIFTRKPENCVHTERVRLLIIDDVLLLHHTRGHVLETIIARTRMQIRNRAQIRLVGLSSTLQSSADVARFLQVDLNDGLFELDCSSYTSSTQHIGISEKKPFQRFQSMNNICTQAIVTAASRQQQVLVFVHSREDAARTARAIREATLGINIVDTNTLNFIEDQIASIANDDLKDLLPRGFALLHAGLSRGDRQIVKTLFEGKRLKVLISTRSEVWGMNLSADTVVIKGTEEYNPEKGAWMELSSMEIRRMLGVGRKTQGSVSGIIITGEEKRKYYMALMADRLRIESQFLSKLADQLNAEIVLGTVKNAKKACVWLSRTYLYFCMLRNPKLYGLPLAEDKTLEGRIADLIHSAATILDNNNMLKYDRRSGDFQVTELGRIASYCSIAHGTIATFNKHLKPRMGDEDLYRLLSLSEELKYVAVRQDEKTELAKLFPGGVRDPSAKINVLLHAYISGLQIESLSLTSDMVYIAETAGRLVRALFEIVLRQGWAQLAKKALNMSKMIMKRMWNDQTPLRQFPKLSLAAPDLQSTPTGLQVKLQITLDFPWDDVVSEGFWILVEDNDGHKILHHEYVIVQKGHMGEILDVGFTVPVPFLSQCVVLVVIDAWIVSHVKLRVPCPEAA